MPVKVEDRGKVVWFSSFEKLDCQFFLRNDVGREVRVESPLELSSDFKDKEFDLFFLSKKNVKENEIAQVFCPIKKLRIGWIIPIAALGSKLHDYSDNPHFLKYAYIAIRDSLKKLDGKLYSRCIEEGAEECQFVNIFHDETVLLVLSKETYEEGFEFCIDGATPSLLKHGYVKLTNRNPKDITFEVNSETVEKIKLEYISNQVEGHSLIADILNSSFAYEIKPAFRFFYIYQIFELLIDIIYQHEQSLLVRELVDAKGDSGKTKEALEELQRFMSEKKRISLLIDEYTNVRNDLAQLKLICNDLLRTLNRRESDSFSGYFYSIRNYIFHQYRDFPDAASQDLNDIVLEAVSIIPHLLSSFRVPAARR